MQADPSERTSDPDYEGGPPLIPILAGLVVVVALAVWWFFPSETESPAPETAPEMPAPAPEPEPEAAPDIPPAAPEPAPAPAPDVAPEPVPAAPPLTLETSDTALRQQFAPELTPGPLASVLQTDNLVERGVAVIDGISNGVLQYKLLPVLPPEGKFAVRKRGSQAVMDPAGYARYDAYAKAIESLDTDLLVAAFHRFRPVLEEAYAMLGYDEAEFDNTLVRSLDTVLAAPVEEGLLEIRKVEAVYKFEEPRLERLPELHKQLLRMGPENTRRIQAQARALRAGLLGP